MSAVLAVALFLEVLSVVLLRRRLGRTWLRRPATLLVLASVACQGLPAVLLAFPSVAAWDIYRQGVAQSYVDDATLIMSAGMLALTFCYLATRPERAIPAPGAGEPAVVMPDWRLLALACLPLAILTYSGHGYNNTQATGAGAGTGTVLASAFFVILVILASFSFALRHGHFVPVLIAQSLLLAAAGERTPVLAGAVALMVLLCRAGQRPSSRQLRAAGALTVVAILAVTGVRASEGRGLFYRDSGLGQRAAALAGAVTAIGSTASPGHGAPGLPAQAAQRLDGDAFAGAVLQSEHMGQPRLPWTGVPASLLEVVPSALWPAKLDHATESLDPALTQIDDFGLQKVNFLPDLTGLYFGYLSQAWLIACLAFLGLLCGWGERWLLRSLTPARLVLLASAVVAATDFQAGLPGMLSDVRTGVVTALAVKAISSLDALRGARRHGANVRADMAARAERVARF